MEWLLALAECSVFGTYRSDGVQRVLDGQQQNFVPTGGVVSVGGPGDSFAGGEVEEGLLLGYEDCLSGST